MLYDPTHQRSLGQLRVGRQQRKEVTGAGGNGNASLGFNDRGASVWEGAKVLEDNCGDGHSAVQTHLIQPSYPYKR